MTDSSDDSTERTSLLGTGSQPFAQWSRKKATIGIAIASTMIALVMLVSRLADFGFVPAEGFGAGDWKRGNVTLEVRVLKNDADPGRKLGPVPSIARGEQLRFSYGRTRYPFLWIVRIDDGAKVTSLLPDVDGKPPEWGRRTAPLGEVIPRTVQLDDDAVVLGMFSAVPRTLEEIRQAAVLTNKSDPEAIARELHLPSWRFVHKIRVTGSGAQ